MRFLTSSVFLTSWLLAAVTPTLAHNDLSGEEVQALRSRFAGLDVRQKIQGRYDHSTSSATLKARGLQERKTKDPVEIAKHHIAKHSAPGTEFEIDSHYTDTDTGVTHVFAVQTLGGIRIDNARFNVNVLKDSTIYSSGSSFTKNAKVKRNLQRRKEINPLDALKGAIEVLKLNDGKMFNHAEVGRTNSRKKFRLDSPKAKKKHFRKPDYVIAGVDGLNSKPEATLSYMQNPNGELQLTWRLEYDSGKDWLIIYADAHEQKKLHSVGDYGADASYLVYKFGIIDPSAGERTVEVDPFKKKESPLGWHKTPTTEFTNTRGNNVISLVNHYMEEIDFLPLYSPDGGPDLKFEFPFPQDSMNISDWQDAAATQLFYTSNMFHDLLEQLGFTSQAGNFEEEITGESGGEGGDAPDVHAQYAGALMDPEYMNNANFQAPPDGERPRMRMFLFNNPNGDAPNRPVKDSCFDASVVIHEYTHGLSIRLTGGPENSLCLDTYESAGMGEGWSDFYAYAIGMKHTDTREKNFAMGSYLQDPTGLPAPLGIRTCVYSTNTQTNPLTYANLNSPFYNMLVHNTGTIWATMLYEVFWNIVDKYGIDEEIFPKFDENTGLPKDGRNLSMKIVLEAMKLQPCNPTFLDARDAIIDADILLTEGENFCEIWAGFAKRGLGTDAHIAADGLKVNGFSLPRECDNYKKQ
ncbi:Fungalysin metallopeptidase-domain-containing protein [Kalaharituber pfeilii]|nr:Fungalysin metallopeptidase-domain-containing protein [Kalaharituber pfeilii]